MVLNVSNSCPSILAASWGIWRYSRVRHGPPSGPPPVTEVTRTYSSTETADPAQRPHMETVWGGPVRDNRDQTQSSCIDLITCRRGCFGHRAILLILLIVAMLIDRQRDPERLMRLKMRKRTRDEGGEERSCASMDGV